MLNGTTSRVWAFGLVLCAVSTAPLVSGCAEDAQPKSQESTGNAQLGIARFTIEDTTNRTSVIGLDANGREVARVDVVHGRFDLTGIFKEDYETPTVDGRQLSISVSGQRMQWETAGYEPVLGLPTPPESQWAISTLIADPVVKQTLSRWKIGFEPVAGQYLSGESPYVTGSNRGTSPQACNGQANCGTAYNGTVNTCGGGAAAIQAARVTQTAGTNCGLYSSSYDQVIVSQCCPAGSGNQPGDWFAQKACPTTSNNSTSCGTRTSGACKSCPAYPTEAWGGCSISVGASVGTCGSAVHPVNWYYDATCYGCGNCGCDYNGNCMGRLVGMFWECW